MLNDAWQQQNAQVRGTILLDQFNIQHYTFNIVQELPCPI
jgi:hypothetical protein